MTVPWSLRTSASSRARGDGRCLHKLRTICSSFMACAPSASRTMRIPAFRARAGRASRDYRPTRCGITRRTPPPSRASIRAMRRSCASPGTASGSAGWHAVGRGGSPGPTRRMAALCELAPIPIARRRARRTRALAHGARLELGEGRLVAEGEALCDPLLRLAWERGLNSPTTTSVGRLFDAAAALLGECRQASHEGEAGMRLEALCHDAAASSRPLSCARSAMRRASGAATGRRCCRRSRARIDPAARARLFHATLAHALCAQALAARRETGVNRVGLCGGVFQNRILSEQVRALLTEEGFEVLMPRGSRSTMRPSAWVSSPRPSPHRRSKPEIS